MKNNSEEKKRFSWADMFFISLLVLAIELLVLDLFDLITFMNIF